MNWNGRIVGALVGVVLLGPIGALVGVVLGLCYDKGWFNQWFGTVPRHGAHQQSKVQAVFFNATFSVMGHLAKSDGRVSEREIQVAQQVMARMDLDAESKRRAIEAFNRGKSPGFDLDAVLNELKRTCWYRPQLLKIFLETQVQIAYSNGQHLSPSAARVLQRICQHLGVSSANFSQFEDQFRAQQNYQRYRQQSSGSAHAFGGQSRLDQAYRILGVDKSATDAEVKKAYRKLMSENHPDRLIAKGVPESMIKLATEKTQQISKAYEEICAARGTRK